MHLNRYFCARFMLPFAVLAKYQKYAENININVISFDLKRKWHQWHEIKQ